MLYTGTKASYSHELKQFYKNIESKKNECENARFDYFSTMEAIIKVAFITGRELTTSEKAIQNNLLSKYLRLYFEYLESLMAVENFKLKWGYIYHES